MFRNIVLKTLYEKRKGLFWWGISLFLLVFYMCYMVPTVIDKAGIDYNEILEAWPEDMKALMLGSEVDMGTPAGFLNAELFNMFLPLLFLIYTIGTAVNSIAGEEEEGTLDLLLSTPISRVKVLLHKFLALFVSLGVIGLLTWLGFVLGIVIYDIDLSISKITAAMTSTLLLSLALGMVGFAFGATVGKKGAALGAAAGAGVLSFLLNGLSQIVDYLEPFQKFSLFYYQVNSDPLRNGLKLGDAGVFIGVITVLLLVAWLGFRRRDLAV